MCGIYATNKNINIHQVSTKLESINFRGPDNTGVEKIGNVILGHLRLSIIDLEERSNQPFHFKHLSITFNGEIYNFVALRNDLIKLGYTFETESDTEVLLVGYYHWGKDLLSRVIECLLFVFMTP